MNRIDAGRTVLMMFLLAPASRMSFTMPVWPLLAAKESVLLPCCVMKMKKKQSNEMDTSGRKLKKRKRTRRIK
jgi:hypothetical protein